MTDFEQSDLNGNGQDGKTHTPVLLQESIESLNIRPDGVYVDLTLGRGGHSSAIAQKLDTGRLLCFDRDQEAIDEAAVRLAGFGDKVTLIKATLEK
jgi:16S rRNA (cytosine1402-N4)-methyltransferase